MAACVKALYGGPNWLMLLQFFVYYRLKGVDRFFMKVTNSALVVDGTGVIS